MFYKTDANGNFYQMEVGLPEGVEVNPLEPIISEKPILYIWKWERIKQLK